MIVREIVGKVVGGAWQIHTAFSNLDAYAPDGLMRPTTVEIVAVVRAP